MALQALLFTVNGEVTAPLKEALARKDFSVLEVRTRDRLRELLRAGTYDVLMHRCVSVAEEQLEILYFIRDQNLPTRVVLLPKTGSVQEAMNAVKAGAGDVIISQELNDRLAETVLRSILGGGDMVARKGAKIKSPVFRAGALLIGQSPLIEEVRTAIDLVAPSQTPVLITGESGTGKEVVARLIHLQSGRADKPFIALNCAALPKDVIENELFGHEKGAFTGALDKKAGAFELAHRGTLFFDEVAEMSPETQAKLLRAIETKAFRRLGGKEEINVDARTIAATNKKMVEALKSGEFREDLYYRFSVIEIYMPPLRERRDDIPLLADHFLGTVGRQYGKGLQKFSAESVEILKAYDWPGNVRELRNVVERAVVTCREKVISPKWLPDRISMLQHIGTTVNLPVGISVKDAERRFIMQTLAAVGHNKTKAAQLLGLSRKTLHNKLREIMD